MLSIADRYRDANEAELELSWDAFEVRIAAAPLVADKPVALFASGASTWLNRSRRDVTFPDVLFRFARDPGCAARPVVRDGDEADR